MVEFATFNTRYYSQRGNIVVPAWEYLRHNYGTIFLKPVKLQQAHNKCHLLPIKWYLFPIKWHLFFIL